MSYEQHSAAWDDRASRAELRAAIDCLLRERAALEAIPSLTDSYDRSERHGLYFKAELLGKAAHILRHALESDRDAHPEARAVRQAAAELRSREAAVQSRERDIKHAAQRRIDDAVRQATMRSSMEHATRDLRPTDLRS